MSNSLQPHGLQLTRPPCPSPTPGVYLNSCPLSRWCHPTMLSSVVSFSSCLQSSQHHSLFHESVLRISGQSIGVSAAASVLPMNIQDWFPLGNHFKILRSLTDLELFLLCLLLFPSLLLPPPFPFFLPLSLLESSAPSRAVSITYHWCPWNLFMP